MSINNNCVGCGACVVACPQKCISFDTDRMGFKYPHINSDKCIECGRCVKVCPLNYKELSDDCGLNLVYAAYSQDTNVRKNSSSGGVFSELAKYIISCGGIVFGCGFEQMVATHISVDSEEKIELLRGSKYVQSSLIEIFEEIETELKKGRLVYFSGTPCQIESIYAFLGSKYSNLITQDIVCHGVMSPEILNMYISEKESKKNSSIISVNFRDKTYGWNNYGMRVCWANGMTQITRANDDWLLRCYSSNLCLRDSCYKCKYKCVNRRADITLADFWGIEKIDSSLDCFDGISCVFPHTEKGRELFESISDRLKYKQEPLEAFIRYNKSMIISPEVPERKNEFSVDFSSGMTLEKLEKKYFHRDNYFKRFLRIVKRKLLSKI